MNTDITGFLAVLFVLFMCIRWWIIAKRTPYRKDILLLGICWLITIVAYIIGMTFDIWPLVLICVITFLGFWFFLIKAIIAEYRFKKQSSKDKL